MANSSILGGERAATTKQGEQDQDESDSHGGLLPVISQWPRHAAPEPNSTHQSMMVDETKVRAGV